MTLERLCDCGCGRYAKEKLKGARIFFHNLECKELWLKFNPSCSRVRAYMVLDIEDVIEPGDRLLFQNTHYGITRSSRAVGNKVKDHLADIEIEILLSDIKSGEFTCGFYRPLIVESNLGIKED